MDKYRKDTCECGKQKDKRAKMCLECRNLLNDLKKKAKEKVCNGCGKILPISEYGLRKQKNGKKISRSRCKECRANYSRDRLKAHPEKVKESSRRWAKKNPDRVRMWAIRSRWKKLGYDPDYIEKLILEYDGVCQICGEDKKLALDHDHNTGNIRGFLCNNCNMGIGKFRDNTDLLKKAIDYLKSNNNL